jgi:hypothetical protein
MPMADENLLTISALYRRFAQEEAAGRSPLYETLARSISEDEAVLRFLAGLPPAKRQPNLLLAAFRYLCGTPGGMQAFRETLLARVSAVRNVMLSRRTQTNEAARCATLLPILARLPQPLALVEVGAAAGLCLLPDRYGYDYGERRLRPMVGGAGFPVFSCAADAGVPLPAALPRIAWRAGLDLHPLDAADPDDARWLESLVWPGQEARFANLRAALRVTAAEGPRMVAGDLTGDALPALCREAPRGATIVVFHSAALAYVQPAARRAFAERVSSLCDVWISNEAPGVFPEIARAASPPIKCGSFLLSVNNRPVGWADPHGVSLNWIADRSAWSEEEGAATMHPSEATLAVGCGVIRPVPCTALREAEIAASPGAGAGSGC